MYLFTFICFLLASVCLQIAALASEGQVELYQRLSFERGRCYFPCQKVETQLRGRPNSLRGTCSASRFNLRLKSGIGLVRFVCLAASAQPKTLIVKLV